MDCNKPSLFLIHMVGVRCRLLSLYRPDWVYSGRLELLVWGIPLLVIIFLGGVIWIGSHDLDHFKPIKSQSKPTEVQVVSLDWKWLFIYPEQGGASVNELVVPAGVPVHFRLTSATVMNQFFVPQLGSMIATMNGMVTQLYLQADHPGDYSGQSAQFSGEPRTRHYENQHKAIMPADRDTDGGSVCPQYWSAVPSIFACLFVLPEKSCPVGMQPAGRTRTVLEVMAS